MINFLALEVVLVVAKHFLSTHWFFAEVEQRMGNKKKKTLFINIMGSGLILVNSFFIYDSQTM